MGEAAALSLLKGMRRGQNSPVDKSLKRPAREPRNGRKDFMVLAGYISIVYAPLSRCAVRNFTRATSLVLSVP